MTNQNARRFAGVIAAGAALMLSTEMSHAVDVQPFDWTPAPAGTHIVSFYNFIGHNDGVAVGGGELEGSLNSFVLMPRYTYYFDLGGKPAAVSAVLPFGRLSNGSLAGAPLEGTTSLGDMSLVAASWLVNEPEDRRYLSLAGYLTLPTGGFDSQRLLNLGNDRFAATLQLGGQTALSEKLTLDATIDAAVYSNNDNANALGATLRQDPVYSFQTWLTYQATPTTSLSAGYAAYAGGDQSLDRVDTGFNAEKHQIRFGVTSWITPTLALYGQVNHDFGVDGGFKQNISTVFRIAKVF